MDFLFDFPYKKYRILMSLHIKISKLASGIGNNAYIPFWGNGSITFCNGKVRLFRQHE